MPGFQFGGNSYFLNWSGSFIKRIAIITAIIFFLSVYFQTITPMIFLLVALIILFYIDLTREPSLAALREALKDSKTI